MVSEIVRLLWNRTNIRIGLLAGLLLGMGSAANAQMSCVTIAGVPLALRPNGVTELVADVVTNCTGGTPTPLGQPIPLYTVQVSLNTNITNRIVGAGNISDAIFTIDEPFPTGLANPPTVPPPTVFNAQSQLGCLASNTTNCAIASVGQGIGSTGSYNGSPGHYNVFQGVQTATGTITWTGVPIDAPGTAGTRVLRFTGIRANASLIGASTTLVPNVVYENIAFTGSPQISNVIAAGGPAVGNIQSGFSSIVANPGTFSACTSANSSLPVSTSEPFILLSANSYYGVPYSFLEQNYGQVLSAQAGVYTAPNGPSGLDQNVVGFRYNTESGFRLDPSLATGTFVDPSGLVGLADHGTQLQLTIGGVAPGVSLSVPSYVYLSATFQQYGGGLPYGVAVLTGQAAPSVVLAPNATAPGPNVPLTVTNGTATAIYEIFYADPNVIETATMPVSVSFPAGVAPGTATVTVSLASLSTNPNASSLDPIPRFTQTESAMTLFTITPCATPALPTLTSVSPNNGIAGATVPVTLTGTNFVAGATVNVSNPGVTVSSVNVVSGTEITATFTIAADAVTGAAGVTLTTSGGTSGAVGFSVNPGPPTLTSISPNSGAAGSVVPVTLTGTNFVAGATVNVSNPGITVGNVIVVSPTEITATFAIAANAATGLGSVSVSTSSGLSQALNFTVNAATLTLSSIAPASGVIGSTVPVTLTTGFLAGATVNAAGIVVSNVTVVSATQITATFAIAASAPAGPINVTVTTSAGTSTAVSFTISAAPAITLSATSLSFSYVQGSATPPVQSFGVLSTGTAANYSVTASTSSGNGWLSAASSSAVTPGNVMVGLQNLAALSVGTYQGTVTVSPQSSAIKAQTVAVTLLVTGAQPAMTLSTSDLRFAVNSGGSAVNRSLEVLNTGGGTVNYSVIAGSAAWLAITCGAQGSATSASPGVICLQINPAGLAAATYYDTLTVSSAGQQLPVSVTLQVSSSAASILLSSSGMTFTAVAGAAGASPASQTVAVLNGGQGTMSWSAQISGSAPWLDNSPASGSSLALGGSQPAITFTAYPGGLAAGNYYAVVNVTAPDGANSPAPITVLLQVLAAGSQVPPSVSSAGFIFSTSLGGAAPAAQQLILVNEEPTTLGYSLTLATGDRLSWLSAGPPSGSVPAGALLTMPVQVNPTGLAVGVYQGQLRFGYSNATAENVDVVLLVTGSSSSQTPANKGVLRPSDSTSCSQYGLIFDQSTAPTDGGTVIAGQSYSLHVNSTCVPSPPDALNLEIDFSDGTAPLYPTFDSASGDYEVTWTPTQAESVQFYARSNPTTAAELAAQTQPFSVTVTAPNPAGAPILAGVRNSASYLTANEVSAGSFISIFGAQLASAPTAASDLPFPTQLGGIQATLAGTALPLYFASPGQVNAIVPYLPQALLDTPQSLVVYRNGAPALIPLNVVVYQPGIFSTAANGQGQGAIQNANYQLVDDSHPAQAGDTILIYGAGLGPVANPPAAGAAAATGSTTNTIPKVYIDGMEAQVVYSGLSPGSVQLYQVNAVVPQGIHAGVVNVYMTVMDPASGATLQSNTVTMN